MQFLFFIVICYKIFNLIFVIYMIMFQFVIFVINYMYVVKFNKICNI